MHIEKIQRLDAHLFLALKKYVDNVFAMQIMISTNISIESH